jgi:MoaA/NifB/PqqE/SkfB family radical SAM enzyme
MADLWPSEEEAEKVLDRMVAGGMISRAIAQGSKQYLKTRVYPEHRCVLGYVQLIIRANGDVYLGCHDLEPVGNVVHDSLGRILSSSAAAETARRMYALEFDKCPCGWQVDRAYSHPLSILPYIGKRLTTRQPTPMA